MIAISVKCVASPSTAPPVPQSVAAGNGPEATKLSMSAGAASYRVTIISVQWVSAPESP